MKIMSLEEKLKEEGKVLKEIMSKMAKDGVSRPNAALLLGCSLATVRSYAAKYKITFKTKKSNWCKSLVLGGVPRIDARIRK